MMRPKSITVTSSNSPVYIPTNWRGEQLSIIANPNGAGNYDVDYTTQLPESGDFINDVTSWVSIASAETLQITEQAPVAVTCLRITLNSGTNVVVDVAQEET